MIVGTGIDLCEVERIEKAMAAPHGERFRERVFTAGEIAYAERKANRAERYAARFAAKEAVLKALGVGIGAAGFREVEVVRGDDGAPGLLLVGRAAALAAARGIRWWHISLTHTDLVAVASVVAEGDA